MFDEASINFFIILHFFMAQKWCVFVVLRFTIYFYLARKIPTDVFWKIRIFATISSSDTIEIKSVRTNHTTNGYTLNTNCFSFLKIKVEKVDN